MINKLHLLWVPNFIALRIYFLSGNIFPWNKENDTCLNVECVLLGHNFGFLGAYLVVTAHYLVVTSCYCLLLLVLTFNMNWADGKTPEVNYILKLSTRWQEILFLSKFSVLVGMLLVLSDVVESSEDIMRAISSLLVRLQKIILSSIFQRAWKVFIRMFSICFSLRNNGIKIHVGKISNLNWVCDSTIIFAFKIFGIYLKG